MKGVFVDGMKMVDEDAAKLRKRIYIDGEYSLYKPSSLMHPVDASIWGQLWRFGSAFAGMVIVMMGIYFLVELVPPW